MGKMWIFALLVLAGLSFAQDGSCQMATQAALDTQTYAAMEFLKVHNEINAISGNQANMTEFKLDILRQMMASNSAMHDQINERTSAERFALPVMFAVLLGFAIAMAINTWGG